MTLTDELIAALCKKREAEVERANLEDYYEPARQALEIGIKGEESRAFKQQTTTNTFLPASLPEGQSLGMH